MNQPQLVVRPATGLAGIAGRFDEADLQRLTALHWMLAHVAPHTRYVDYPGVEAACRSLAGRLREELGAGITHWPLSAIPRGGWFVLGVMSYLLGQGDPEPEAEARPLVVFDDVAYSGDRFRRHLARLEASEIVFAPLFSTPQLRSAIPAAEPRVVSVVSGVDLVDHAPERLGDDHGDWEQRWTEHDDRYWDGQPDHVVFPWNEPDIRFWNRALDTSESGWRLVPPELCLKNQATDTPIRTISEWSGWMRLAPSTLYAQDEESVVVADTAGGQVVRLTGTSAFIWDQVANGRERSETVAAVVSSYNIDVGTAGSDVDELIAQLITAGLLVDQSDDS